MECLGEDVNRMVCRGGGWGLVLDWIGIGDGGDGNWGMGKMGLSLGLGDCVWCVLLPEPVANATISSKTTPPVSHN